MRAADRQQVILDHARRRHGQAGDPSTSDPGRRLGQIVDPTTPDPVASTILVAEAVSPTCGDRFHVRVRVRAGVVVDVTWTGRGCAVSTASASMLAELLSTPRGALPRERREVRIVDVPALVAVVEAIVDVADPELGTIPVSRHLGEGSDVVALAGIGRLPLRRRCALLPWIALRDAVTAARVPQV